MRLEAFFFLYAGQEKGDAFFKLHYVTLYKLNIASNAFRVLNFIFALIKINSSSYF